MGDQRIIGFQRDIDLAVARLGNKVKPVVEELAEEGHPSVEGRRQADIGRQVGDLQPAIRADFHAVAACDFGQRGLRRFDGRARALRGRKVRLRGGKFGVRDVKGGLRSGDLAQRVNLRRNGGGQGSGQCGVELRCTGCIDDLLQLVGRFHRFAQRQPVGIGLQCNQQGCHFALHGRGLARLGQGRESPGNRRGGVQRRLRRGHGRDGVVDIRLVDIGAENRRADDIHHGDKGIGGGLRRGRKLGGNAIGVGGDGGIIGALRCGLFGDLGIDDQLQGGDRRRVRSSAGSLRGLQRAMRGLDRGQGCGGVNASHFGVFQRGQNCGRVVQRLVDDQVGDRARVGIDDVAGLAVVALHRCRRASRPVKVDRIAIGIIHELRVEQPGERLIRRAEILLSGHQVVQGAVHGAQTEGHQIGVRRAQPVFVLDCLGQGNPAGMRFGDLDLAQDECQVRGIDMKTRGHRMVPL